MPLVEVSFKRNLTLKTKSTAVHYGSLCGVPLTAEEQSLNNVHLVSSKSLLTHVGHFCRSITHTMCWGFFKYQITARRVSSLLLHTKSAEV